MAPLIFDVLDWTVLLLAALAPIVSLVLFLWQLVASRCGAASAVSASDDLEGGMQIEPTPKAADTPADAVAQISAASGAARPFRRQASNPQLVSHRVVHKYPCVRGHRRRSHEEPSVTVPPAPPRRQSMSLDCGVGLSSQRDGHAKSGAQTGNGGATLW